MPSSALPGLLKLSANERAELALALWESLEESEREAEVALTSEQRMELDRRLSEHDVDPSSAIAWDEVRRKLTSGE